MISPISFHKTRIAPTPSGFLHLGNIFSFALTAALAQRTGAEIFLRIDDLDIERTEARYVEDIFTTLKFLSLPFTHGPKNAEEFRQHFSQLKRLSIYNKTLDQLRQENRVFACTCSRKQILESSADGAYPGTCLNKGLPLDHPDAAWRLKTAEDHRLTVKGISENIPAVLPSLMQNFVVRKKDGLPSYQLASMVDDLHYGIDLIVRGQDLWDSTLAQLYLATVLNEKKFLSAVFYHHPLLVTDGRKMSKSAGAESVHYLRGEGWTAEAVWQRCTSGLGMKKNISSWQELSALFLDTHKI